MNIIERKAAFELELKALLVKFDCALSIEDFSRDWSGENKIVVDFNTHDCDFDLEEIDWSKHPSQLVIGIFEDGK